VAEDPNEPGSGPGHFDSPLDDLFVEGAQFHEPSAAERATWAKAAHAASKRRKRRARRDRWQVRRKLAFGRAVPWLVFAGVVVIVYMVWTGGGGGGGPEIVAPEQVRVVYATPSDVEVDEALVDAIRNEVRVADAWFGEQAGRSPKWLEEGGVVAVEQRTLSHSSAELADRSDAVGLVADDFADEDGGLPSNEVVLVFVPLEFESQERCGESGLTVVVVWVGSCGDVPSTETTELDGGISGTVAHELLHAMSAVPRCAPHYGNNGHVVDDPRDVMYDPGENGEPGATRGLLLDPGNDDYYDHDNPGCPDVRDHPLWD